MTFLLQSPLSLLKDLKLPNVKGGYRRVGRAGLSKGSNQPQSEAKDEICIFDGLWLKRGKVNSSCYAGFKIAIRDSIATVSCTWYPVIRMITILSHFFRTLSASVQSSLCKGSKNPVHEMYRE